MAPRSSYENAFETAYGLAYAKDEPADAARVLDLALAEGEDAGAVLRFKAYVLRADIAFGMDELDLAARYIRQANQVTLSDHEFESAREAAERRDELKAALEYDDPS
ncbi:MAG: hypothetical protein K0Q94_3112 [Paenibacillus sp.]|jgi:hypothetical protein|uniref:hypothetical protein n=1 Tax=Paenibacillus sp. GCM10012303 TaxID=3317340 RepID=UPI0029EA5792|nr:hypothetical protein [Paenibacillus sp.]